MQELNQRLLEAAKQSPVDQIADCLSQGADINTINTFRETPLIAAVVAKSISAVQLLLQQPNIDLHIQSYLRGTALTFAVFTDQTDMAKLLLEKEQSFDNSKHPGALNWAIMNDNRELIKFCVNKGADINATGLTGYQPVPERIWKPELDPRISPFHSEAFSFIKHTPLCLAVYTKNKDMVTFLLEECKANPNQLNYDNNSPLAMAVQQNNIELVKLLLSHNADPDLASSKEPNENVPAFFRRKPPIDPQIQEELRERMPAPH